MNTTPTRRVAQDAPHGIGRTLQNMSGPDQVMVLALLLESATDARQFTARDVADLRVHLRLPEMPGLTTVLSRLGGRRLLMRPRNGYWSLTPNGRVHASELVPGQSDLEARAELQVEGSTLGSEHHRLIPAALAPVKVREGLRQLLADGDFDDNVMLISRFPKSDSDPLNAVFSKVRDAVEAHGMQLRIASDGNADDNLWHNVMTYMWGSRYAIALVDSRDGALNPNVLVEIGGMLMTGRRCAILRDETVGAMPTDLVGHIYRAVNFEDSESVALAVHEWARADIGRGRCKSCA